MKMSNSMFKNYLKMRMPKSITKEIYESVLKALSIEMRLHRDRIDVEEVLKYRHKTVDAKTNRRTCKIYSDRQPIPHNIHATPTPAEEEELESEYTNMKVSQHNT